MKLNSINFTWIRTFQELSAFYNDHVNTEWIAFDTEFIGEKRDKTLLCLIQISTPKGIYLIDCITIDDLTPFLEIIKNPKILKITHAGENDYKILYELYRVIPSNVADVQIAGGFSGYKYPVSLANLLEKELQHKLDKSFTVIDWDKRPLHENYVLYALEDVLYLKELFDKLMQRIEMNHMTSWVEHEFKALTDIETYVSLPEKEAIQVMLQNRLRNKEKIFVLRLFEWRFAVAEKTGKLKERILPKKWIVVLARQLKLGKTHLLSNRALSSGFIEANWYALEKIYLQNPTENELNIVRNIESDTTQDPIHESLQELVLSLIRYQCRLKGVDPSIVLPPYMIRMLRNLKHADNSFIENTWRHELLGKDFMEWLDFDNLLQIKVEKDQITIEKSK